METYKKKVENTGSEIIDREIQDLFKSIKNTANKITNRFLLLTHLDKTYGLRIGDFKELYSCLNIPGNRIGLQSNLMRSILPLTNNLGKLDDEQKGKISTFLKKCLYVLNQIKDNQQKETSNL